MQINSGFLQYLNEFVRDEASRGRSEFEYRLSKQREDEEDLDSINDKKLNPFCSGWIQANLNVSAIYLLVIVKGRGGLLPSGGKSEHKVKMADSYKFSWSESEGLQLTNHKKARLIRILVDTVFDSTLRGAYSRYQRNAMFQSRCYREGGGAAKPPCCYPPLRPKKDEEGTIELGQFEYPYNLRSLHGFLDRGKVIHLLQQVAEFLGRLHQSGYIHGDIASENIEVVEGCKALMNNFEFRAKLGESPVHKGGIVYPDWDYLLNNHNFATTFSDVWGFSMLLASLLLDRSFSELIEKKRLVFTSIVDESGFTTNFMQVINRLQAYFEGAIMQRLQKPVGFKRDVLTFLLQHFSIQNRSIKTYLLIYSWLFKLVNQQEQLINELRHRVDPFDLIGMPLKKDLANDLSPYHFKMEEAQELLKLLAAVEEGREINKENPLLVRLITP